MNIFEKLQDCRAQLITKDLKQTGLNKFSNYTYFELGDFLPKAIEIMKTLKMTAIFGFEAEKATLKIINAEVPEEIIEFSTPSLIPELKGSNALQNIGATQTYMRRYLYTMALELSDFDMVNTSDPVQNDKAQAEKEAQEEMDRIAKEKVKKSNVDALTMKLEKKGVAVEIICETYKVEKLGDMTFEQWQHAMNRLEKTADKPQADLGL